MIYQERMKTALTRLVVYKKSVNAGADIEYSATPLTAVQALQKSNSIPMKSGFASAYRSGQTSIRKSGDSPAKVGASASITASGFHKSVKSGRLMAIADTQEIDVKSKASLFSV